MFDKFTDRARQMMTLARAEAQRLGSEFVGTEHALLGIIAEGGGVSAMMFRHLKVDLKALRAGIERLIIIPSAVPTVSNPNNLSFTPRMMRALNLAEEEASHVGGPNVGTGHLLIGLFKEEDSIASQAMKSVGLDLDQLCAAMRHAEKGTGLFPLEVTVTPLVPDLQERTHIKVTLLCMKDGGPRLGSRTVFIGEKAYVEGETIMIGGVAENRVLAVASALAKEYGTDVFIVE